MNIRCPHCHAAVDTLQDGSWTDIECPCCGSNFSLISGDATRAHEHGRKVIAHFELLEEVGLGKFGSVWKARDTKLQRTVAVKIPRQADLDPKQTDMFLRDARAAAQLRHPRIAGVHEVGREGDTVYIVTDFIHGANLKEWLTGQRLTVREAAELAVKVAETLHHAHETGVVHRDLKPGNIMMDLDGEPHIIDFGLARRETGEVTMTVAGQVLGTPAYMSPEQARGEGHAADRRSDLYSLGVVLFELLTNELPFRGDARMLIVQILRDEPPSPRRLNGLVPRDLETITLKCLQKEPSQRYATAQEVADDLKRFLANEPILARPVGRWERAWRWARRNRAVAAAAMALGTSLLLLAIVSTIAALRINAARQEIIGERDRAESAFRQARQAVDDSLTAVSESKLINVPGLQPLRKELMQKSLKYYEGFLRDRQDDPGIQADLASTYHRVGQIRQIMGELDEAESAYRRAIEIYSGLILRNPGIPQYESRLADCQSNLGSLENSTGRATDAETSHRDALKTRQELAEAHPTSTEYRGKLAGSYLTIANLERNTGRFADAAVSNNKSLGIYEQLAQEDPEAAQFQSELASSYNLRASLERDAGRFPEAEDSNAKALAIRKELVAKNPTVTEYRSDLARSYRSLALLETDAGRLGDAEKSNAKALDIYTKLAQENPAVPEYERDLALTYSNMGNLRMPDRPGQLIQQRDSRRLADAEASYLRGIDILSKLVRESPKLVESQSDLAITYTSLGHLQRTAGRSQKARESFQKALDILEVLVSANPTILKYRSELAFNYTNAANIHKLAGRRAEAESLYQKAIDIRETLAWQHPTVAEFQSELAWSYNRLAALQHLSGRSKEAEQTYRNAIAAWESQNTEQAQGSVRQLALGVLYSQLAKQIAISNGEWGLVVDAIKKASALAPQDAWVQAACGDAAALAAHWREGADAYRRAEEVTDHSWHMMMLHAMLELAAGDNAAYEAVCRDFFRRHGDNENQNVELSILFVCGLGENAADNWEPIIQMARKIIEAEPSNPLPRVGLGAALQQAGNPAEAVKVLAAVVPQHTVAMMIVPEKRDALLQSQLMAETYLAVAYNDLGKNDEAQRAKRRAEQINRQMEELPPKYDELLVLWANRYAPFISRRKLALRFDAAPSDQGASAQPVAPSAEP